MTTPEDAHLVETGLESEVVFQGAMLHVRRDHVRLPNGGDAKREYVVHPGAALVIPILDDGRFVLERQYRYPVRRVMLEFPAGKIDPGEPPLRCAIRELGEETGYQASEWARAGILHNAIAYSNEGIEVWFARGLTPGNPKLDQGEFLEVTTATFDELMQAAKDGELTDAKSLICLLWLQNWHNGSWSLSWQKAP